MTPARLSSPCLVFLLAILAAVSTAQVTVASDVQHWFACTLGDAPCGWMEFTEQVEDEKRTSISRLRIILRRGDSKVESGIESRLIESLDGKPVEMSAIQELGGNRIERKWLFLPNRIRELTVDGRRQRTALRPIPEGTWYTTAQAQRKAASMIGEPSSETPILVCRVLDPSLGEKPVETKYFFEGRETLPTPEGPIECTSWRIKHADSPASREWLNDGLQLVRARTELGGGLGEIEMRRATRAEAQAEGNAPEIMLSTVISPTMPEGAFPHLDWTARLKMKVRRKDGGKLELPSIGAQKVSGEDGELVTVDIRQGSPMVEEEGVDWLASTPFADTTDEKIRSFATRAAGHRVSAADRAESIRESVYRHISRKNLGTAFGSASDTVRSRSGDCTEHAVLLTAALRAQGIPARVVNGLIWVRNVPGGRSSAFLWHMWTQAYYDGKWWDLDATLSGQRAFHAGHLAVSLNDLSTESFNRSATEMLEVLGNLEIEVLEADSGHER